MLSQEHPVFTATKAGVTWLTDIDGKTKGMVLENYPDIGLRKTKWFVEGVEKYHRTFSDIINALVKAGFAIQEIREPSVLEEIIEKKPALSRCRHVPDYLFVLCGV